jgi:hypothetical protein
MMAARRAMKACGASTTASVPSYTKPGPLEVQLHFAIGQGLQTVISKGRDTLYACDFFSVETLGVFGTVRHMVFSVIEIRTRAVHIVGIRVDPDGNWAKNVATASALLHPREVRIAIHMQSASLEQFGKSA